MQEDPDTFIDPYNADSWDIDEDPECLVIPKRATKYQVKSRKTTKRKATKSNKAPAAKPPSPNKVQASTGNKSTPKKLMSRPAKKSDAIQRMYDMDVDEEIQQSDEEMNSDDHGTDAGHGEQSVHEEEDVEETPQVNKGKGKGKERVRPKPKPKTKAIGNTKDKESEQETTTTVNRQNVDQEDVEAGMGIIRLDDSPVRCI